MKFMSELIVFIVELAMLFIVNLIAIHFGEKITFAEAIIILTVWQISYKISNKKESN